MGTWLNRPVSIFVFGLRSELEHKNIGLDLLSSPHPTLLTVSLESRMSITLCLVPVKCV